MTHMEAIELRLSHERSRLAAAKTAQERQVRQVWAEGIERELKHEKEFLGIADSQTGMSDQDLLQELLGDQNR